MCTFVGYRCICFVLFNDTATTEIYTYCTLFPYTTLFRARPGGSRGRAVRARQHRIEPREIIALVHLDRPQAFEVRGDELAVEQAPAAGDQPRDEMRERDLRRVARPADPPLAEERPPERHAVEDRKQRGEGKRVY